MTTETKTLRIRADTLRLSEADPVALRFPPEFCRIHIEADTVYVEGWIQWFGREVTILARRIVANPVDGRMALIDVSGAPAEPSFDPAAPSAQLKGTPAAPDGRQGQDGGAGHDGGSLSMRVDVIDGELGLAANGSDGGDSQRGGDGVKPARPDGAHGAFQPGDPPVKGRHGGGVLQRWSIFWPYVAWARGAPGGRGRQGGSAGAPGRPGDGGHGGQVTLLFVGPTSPRVKTTARGGRPGTAGPPSKAGPAGDPGLGGKSYVYVHWKGKHKGYAHESRNRYVVEMVKKHKLPARAARGVGTAGAGRVPAPPVASADGHVGEVDVRTSGAAVIESQDMPAWLRLLLAHAERRLRAGDHDEALARFRWLAQVTAPRAADDADAAAIQAAATAALQALDAAPVRRPNRQRHVRMKLK